MSRQAAFRAPRPLAAFGYSFMNELEVFKFIFQQIKDLSLTTPAASDEIRQKKLVFFYMGSLFILHTYNATV